MQDKIERLLRHRDHFLELAKAAPMDEMRVKLLSVARLYEIEAQLLENAKLLVSECKELLAAVDAVLHSAR